MTLPLFNHGFRADSYGPRTSAASVGSSLIIANTNAGALNSWGTSGLGNPWLIKAALSDESASYSADGVLSSDYTSDQGYVDTQLFAATIPNHNNIRPITAGGWNYANFYHIWRGNHTITTAPRIQVFGRVPAPAATMGAMRQWPRDDDPDFPDLQEQWIPLTQPGETTAYLDMGTTIGAAYLNKQFISAPGKYVYLQGVDQIIVAVTQIAVYSATQPVTASSGGSSDDDFSSSSSAGSDGSYGMIGVQFSG